jgi:hypothetical protein
VYLNYINGEVHPSVFRVTANRSCKGLFVLCVPTLRCAHALLYYLTSVVEKIRHVCIYVSVCLYVCVCVCACVCMYVCMHVGMYVCMYACMFACMHICT